MEVPIFYLSYALLWVLTIVLVVSSAVLLYLLTALEEQVSREGSGFGNDLIGRQMPILLAKDPTTGAAKNIHDFQGAFHVVLALSPACGTCRGLIKDLSSKPKDSIAPVNLLVLCMGDIESCADAVSDIDHVPVLLTDQNDDSTRSLLSAGFPAALIVDEAGIVIDVRHPLSFEKLKAAVENARADKEYAAIELEVGMPQGAGVQ